ncbi:molybdate-anion transporter [Hydra vulgaris]|uniref:Molybdate-anion transporter n=1 Tax=Hydra vulgaris TaxID=6087 RepID=T2MBI6_HYDVU|nr:molybdate-anion transporter [Hydra vulgaris]
MLVIAYIAFVILLFIGIVIGKQAWQSRLHGVVIINATFIEFQWTYFFPYFLALIAEWLQGPYLYKLYDDYGFVDPYIGIIYVCGYCSSILFGAYTGILIDNWGRKKVCILFTILYSLSCIANISKNFAVLCLGRIIGGASTGLLFSAFDAWYVYEHMQIHKFPYEWLEDTFSKATFFNSIIAISAGIFANLLTEWLDVGAVAPFLLAVPCLCASAILIQLTWSENFGTSTRGCKSCMDSLKVIFTTPGIFLIGSVQAMFESVMYIFVFLWTPVLQPADPPLGIVFSCFMCSIWIGGIIFTNLIKKDIQPTIIVLFVVYGVMLTNFLAALASANHPRTSFLLFLVTEILCGIYFPAMGSLRSKWLPPALHSDIMNLFRVPLNIIASAVLLILHDSHSPHGITQMFLLNSALLLCGGIFSVLLHFQYTNDEKKDEFQIE